MILSPQAGIAALWAIIALLYLTWPPRGPSAQASTQLEFPFEWPATAGVAKQEASP